MRLILFTVIFIFIWAWTDRQREIAIFPKWISRLGKWFDTYFTPKRPKWWPFRDAYHMWKFFAILTFEILVGVEVWIRRGFWFDGFVSAIGVHCFWAIGQDVGLKTKKDKL